MKLEEEYLFVLMDMELAILQTCRVNIELCDHDVLRVVESAISVYRSREEEPDSSAYVQKLPIQNRQMFIDLIAACEKHLVSTEEGNTLKSSSREEILACLKRIQKSIKLWSKNYGRNGYLGFISRHIPEVLAITN